VQTFAELLKQPIAHRGLHDAGAGLIENTPAAFARAIAAGYAIETDLREAACSTPMVFHDETLERLTHGAGLVRHHDAAALQTVRFRGSDARMPRLCDLLEQVRGRVPLFIEIKSDGSEQAEFSANIANILSTYRGPYALMSFDPWLLGRFRTLLPDAPRGLGATRVRYGDRPATGWLRRLAYTHLLLAPVAMPRFIAYDISVLPAFGPWIARHVFRRPLIVWTVRTRAERAAAARYGDAMIFEGFSP
jgi:glycerophosphoryl diester phosphodiesterase